MSTHVPELPLFPGPTPSPDSLPYWQGTAEQRLMIKRCRACGQSHFYPRPICPFCMSADTEWVEASGRARLYTFTPQRKAELPSAIAFVELEEGPRLLALVVDSDPASLAIGEALTARFAPSQTGHAVLVFERDAG